LILMRWKIRMENGAVVERKNMTLKGVQSNMTHKVGRFVIYLFDVSLCFCKRLKVQCPSSGAVTCLLLLENQRSNYFFLDKVRCFSAATIILLESTNRPLRLLTIRMYFNALLSRPVDKSPLIKISP
jgi:hypothetical protein